MMKIDLLKQIWYTLYAPESNIAEIIDRYFDDKYMQCINGVTMNRAEYTDHVIKQKETMIIDTIHYEHFLERDNELFALCYPRGHSVDNQPIEAEVIVYCVFKHDKLLNIQGHVRLIQGDAQDADM